MFKLCVIKNSSFFCLYMELCIRKYGRNRNLLFKEADLMRK